MSYLPGPGPGPAHLDTACGPADAHRLASGSGAASTRGAGRVPRNAINLPGPRDDLPSSTGHLQPREAAPWAGLSAPGGAARPHKTGLVLGAASGIRCSGLASSCRGTSPPPGPSPTATPALLSGRTHPGCRPKYLEGPVSPTNVGEAFRVLGWGHPWGANLGSQFSGGGAFGS